MRKSMMVIMAVLGILIIPAGLATAVEFYDPDPDEPGKFMGPHGPNHTDWHYHGPPANADHHCHEALEDSNAPEGVHESCEGGHH
jgi:hypothetical protein